METVPEQEQFDAASRLVKGIDLGSVNLTANFGIGKLMLVDQTTLECQVAYLLARRELEAQLAGRIHQHKEFDCKRCEAKNPCDVLSSLRRELQQITGEAPIQIPPAD